MVASAEAIRALVEPPLQSSGHEVWDVEVSADTVRVLVDRPGGIDLDALAALAGQVVSPLLDEHPDVTPEGQFSLEVSSPGVERTLRTPAHFCRYVGSEISVKTRVPVEGARRYRGALVGASGEAVVLAPADGPPGRTVSIPMGDIERARTILVWGPADKPGTPKHRKHPKAPAVKRSAAGGRDPADSPVASTEKDT